MQKNGVWIELSLECQGGKEDCFNVYLITFAMNRSYDLLFLRNEEYFGYEEYEDWEFSKENKIICDEYFNELDQYIQYKNGGEKNADYLGTAMKLLREGNCLSIMER